ncbi:MAG: hypothetical protein ACTHKS_10875, partial [Gaiellaceae bacterium]
MSRRTEVVIAGVAAAAAAVAVVVTLQAEFLQYPGWLAVQKADLILGPVLVGLYWLRRRPGSRFGWLLVVTGLINIGYIAQSSSEPFLFGLGVAWESLIYIGVQVLIVTFPSGRASGSVAKLIVAGSLVVAALNVWLVVMLPYTGAGGAISHCATTCPKNGFAFVPNTARALRILDNFDYAVIAVAVATALFVLWRIVLGSLPQRRALLIGASVALVFLVLQISFQLVSHYNASGRRTEVVLQWGFTVARSAVWYGFFAALIAAQLSAGREVLALLRQLLRRPSRDELETMLRRPLADPHFQLLFWDTTANDWDTPARVPVGSTITVVERTGAPPVGLVHSAQLRDDPELVQAAGAVALVAAENAELDTEWR